MTLSEWLGEVCVAERMTGAGMRADCAEIAARCFVRSAAELSKRGTKPNEPVVGVWAPGRIEVLGKHTDYCGGQSLLAAAERGFCFLAAPRADRLVQMIDARREESCEFPLDEQLHARMGHWSNYPQIVARRFVQNFAEASHGAAIAFVSDLPVAAGMSSSSALIVGTFLALAAVNDVCRQEPYVRCIRNREELADYLASVENGTSFGALCGDLGVGTSGGSEDHTAILNCQADALALYAFCPVRFRRSVRIADQYVFAIASSGIAAEKTGSALTKYNRLSLLAAEIVRAWQAATNRTESSLMEVLESAPDAEDQLRRILNDATHAAFPPRELIQRLEHLILENRLIDSVPHRVDAETIQSFGDLVAQSHTAAARMLKNQTPETTRLVELAVRLGAYGASSFGAGFGGSVWAIVDSSDSVSFLAGWRAQYENEFPQAASQAEFFLMRPGVPAITWVDKCAAANETIG